MNRAALMAGIGLAFILLAGPAAWGRLALWTGVPGAARLLDDPPRGGSRSIAAAPMTPPMPPSRKPGAARPSTVP